MNITGGIITIPQGIPDLPVRNMGFKDRGKLIIQMAQKSILMKIDSDRK